MTLECLRSVVAETTLPYELVVLDNDLKDGSVAAIAAEFPGIRLIASRENLGFNVASAGRAASTCCSSTPTPWCSTTPSTASSPSPIARPRRGSGGRTLSGDRSLNPTRVFGDRTRWSLFCRATGLALVFKDSAFFNSEFYVRGSMDRCGVAPAIWMVRNSATRWPLKVLRLEVGEAKRPSCLV